MKIPENKIGILTQLRRILLIVLLSAAILPSCSGMKDKTEELEIEEGNRGMVEVVNDGHTVYQAALNDSGDTVNDTDREDCAAIYDYGSFVLIGDHNYQGFDVLEDVGEGDVLMVIPPTENARNLAAPPDDSVTNDSTASTQSDPSRQTIISPVSGKPMDTGDEENEETGSITEKNGAAPEEKQSPVEYRFHTRLKGVRKYGTLFEEEDRDLRTIASETEAVYITYTCRGNSDADVWIVVWK